MIRKINIQNFKSLSNFEIELGRVNLLIGANGSGKTNLLEGLSLGAAAAGNKLDHESLAKKLRLTAHDYMRSGFQKKGAEDILIEISADDPKDTYHFELTDDTMNRRNWRNKTISSASLAMDLGEIKGIESPEDYSLVNYPRELEDIGPIRGGIYRAEEPRMVYSGTAQGSAEHAKRLDQFATLAGYRVFAPENQMLMRGEESTQVKSLGTKGERFYNAVKRIFEDDSNEDQQAEIKKHLQLFDWFGDLKLSKYKKRVPTRLMVGDRFLDRKLADYDLSSANEGFLRLLFYLVLFTSDQSPQFFAIENLETAMNPRMCWELMRLFANLAKEHNKQFIVTTHNSLALNGLDLNDDEQRLFVASRNAQGHTRVQRITEKPKSGNLLSDLWTRGYIGGMPDNL